MCSEIAWFVQFMVGDIRTPRMVDGLWPYGIGCHTCPSGPPGFVVPSVVLCPFLHVR